MAIYSTDAEVPAEWEMGDEILDKYEVEGKLGEGGFGTVYKVLHYDFAVELAVKCPKPERFLSEKDKQNFIREATNWVQLGLHPHIVTCHYVRMMGGIPRIFAEYVAGGTLQDWIRTRKLYEGGHKVALERILDIAIQTAWGLHYAHQRGLVHQDIKPANVMMTPDGVAKVTDFGLAKARVLATESILVTQMGQTLAYCSPESFRHKGLGRKTDIWSWAVSVLEMFMGYPPCMAGLEASAALEEDYLEDGPQCQDAALLPPMPQEVIELLRHCFQRKTSKRPKNMAEVANRLLAIFQKEMRYNYQHFRRPPEAITDTLADNLNNRALSLMELGEVQKAEELWKKAIEICPQHIEATFNLKVSRWRRGVQQDDVALVLRLQDVCNSFHDQWLPKYLLALVHFERADIDAAIKLLEAASQQVPHNPSLQAAFTLAHSGTLPHARYLRTLPKDTDWVTSHLLLHTDWVNSIAFSPDGKQALSGSDDNTLKVWEVESARLLNTLTGHTSGVNSVAFSPDGKQALSGSDDNTLKVWEVESAHCLRTLTGHTSGVNSVAFSPDGKQALSGSGDKTLKVWEVESARLLNTLTGHTSGVNSVAFSPDGKQALSGSSDKTLKVWEVESARLLNTLTGHTSRVTSVAFSPDGKQALSGSDDNTLKVWEVESDAWNRQYTYWLAPLWSYGAWFDVQRKIESLQEEAQQHLRRQAFSMAHLLLRQARQSLGSQPTATLLTTWQQLYSFSPKVGLQAAWLMRTLTAHTDTVFSVAFSPDGKQALSGSSDKTLKVWEVASGRLLNTLTGHTSGVNSVAFSPDGKQALSGSYDNTLKVWEVASGRLLNTLTGHAEEVTEEVTSVAFSPDGKQALSGSYDNTLKVWEVASGRLLNTLTGHAEEVTEEVTEDEEVTSVVFSPDGKQALSGSYDNTLKVWEVASGHCLRTLTGHTDRVTSVAFSPDGRYALSGSYDHTLKVWALDWELEARELADWDEGARPYLENFLTRQTLYAGTLPPLALGGDKGGAREPTEEEIVALTRRGEPRWTEEEFQRLVRELQGAGYGWLREEGVRARLMHMKIRRG